MAGVGLPWRLLAVVKGVCDCVINGGLSPKRPGSLTEHLLLLSYVKVLRLEHRLNRANRLRVNHVSCRVSDIEIALLHLALFRADFSLLREGSRAVFWLEECRMRRVRWFACITGEHR